MNNTKLIHIIKNADYIIGESAGVKVLGTHYTIKQSDDNYKALPCLGLLPYTVLEGHYSQRNKEPALLRAMQETGAQYGIGIDSLTAMVFELDAFPKEYSTIGEGDIVIKKSSL